MTMQVRQNIYAAYLDGDVTPMEALRSLCADYEEVEQSYKDFEGIRATLRDQIGNVLTKLGDKVEVKGFGVLTMTAPAVSLAYDKAKITALIDALITEGHADIAERLVWCGESRMRSGGLRIERERTKGKGE